MKKIYSPCILSFLLTAAQPPAAQQIPPAAQAIPVQVMMPQPTPVTQVAPPQPPALKLQSQPAIPQVKPTQPAQQPAAPQPAPAPAAPAISPADAAAITALKSFAANYKKAAESLEEKIKKLLLNNNATEQEITAQEAELQNFVKQDLHAKDFDLQKKAFDTLNGAGQAQVKTVFEETTTAYTYLQNAAKQLADKKSALARKTLIDAYVKESGALAAQAIALGAASTREQITALLQQIANFEKQYSDKINQLMQNSAQEQDLLILQNNKKNLEKEKMRISDLLKQIK